MNKKYRRKNILVFGVGVNDADYVVEPTCDGKQLICPYYNVWSHMLRRCYSKSYLVNKPTYEDCSVCDEWLTFLNFKRWMEKQDWQGKHLDKDLMGCGKIYSPENCTFLTNKINCFLRKTMHSKQGLPLGVTFHKNVSKYVTRCCDENGVRVHIGCFDDLDSARLAWLNFKIRVGYKISETVICEKTAKAIREYFEKVLDEGSNSLF